MAEKLLVIGESGSGKSKSLENLDPGNTFLINCIGKSLPFRGWKGKFKTFNKETNEGNMIRSYNSANIISCMDHVSENLPHIKTIIVDDSQYIMSYEFMDRAKEKGYNKFTEIADNMFRVFKKPDELREDLIVIFLCHSEEISTDNGIKTKIKTIGKMLDEKITIEGMFTIVLLSVCFKSNEEDMQFKFVTQSNGLNTVKSPIGMFGDKLIDNDLYAVVSSIREYNEE